MSHGIQKYKCCLGLTDAECANIPSRHCTGLAPDHGTHGPQWVADEIRKAEKMTDKIDTSPEAVRLHSPYHDGSMVLDNDGGWVSIDDYRALFARATIAEQRAATLEERYLAVVGDKINLRGEVATLDAKLAKADAWQEAVFAAHPNIDLDIETKEPNT